MNRLIRFSGATVRIPGRSPEVRDLAVQGGIVVDAPASENDIVIDATGLELLPGLTDLHVHLRDPGLTYKEDIESGTRCAVSSGVTSVVALANTDPVNDNPETTRYVIEQAESRAWCRVLPVSAATMGLNGEELAPYHQMLDAGCVAISDDGATVEKAGVMRRVMEYARSVNLPILPHCEDRSVRAGGVMNAGEVAVSLGLPGNPREAEEICLARDLLLARLTGAHLHVQHVTTAGGINLIRNAKAEGVRVTAEVCPHHLFLTDEAVRECGTHAKMAPPLRTASDVDALRDALREGVIDVIATDHAPHARHEKDLPFEAAPDGIIGLETLMPLCLKLVAEGVMDWERLLDLVVTGPRRVLGASGDVLGTGAPADFCLVDCSREWTYVADDGQSKSNNSPFDTWTFTGRVTTTFVDGVCRWDLDDVMPDSLKPRAGVPFQRP